MLKNSMATLYIDGQLINTVKVRLHVNKIIQFQEIAYIIIIAIITVETHKPTWYSAALLTFYKNAGHYICKPENKQ